MNLTVDALVLRTQNYRESDRLCTLLTRTHGIVYAYARGARNLKNKNFSSTQQLSYARFTLFSSRDRFIIDETSLEHIFSAVLSELERLSLAQYLCELAEELTPPEMNEPYLLLMLRALYTLSKRDRPVELIKAATEMRLMSMSGFMPDLVMCSECGEYETEKMFFMPGTGTIRCEKCGADGVCLPVSRGAVTAMRHCCYTDLNKTYAFDLGEPSLSQFGAACESYLKNRLERSFTTLDFYRSLMTAGSPAAEITHTTEDTEQKNDG
ncbi:MAG: DNA repair protein RecO [Ruminococcaceae bacterium]|nr:DNA repair protein RecO [Oscillospiraceae bacterium]